MPQYTGYPRDEITAKDAELTKKATQLLTQGKEHRQSVRESIWQEVKLQYEGAHWEQSDLEDPAADLTVVNMSFATIQTIKPYITGQEPRFFLEPFSSDATRLSAALQEVYLNRVWRHPPVGAQTALRAAAFDFLTYGDGFLKGTYTTRSQMDAQGIEQLQIQLHVDKVSPWDIWIDPYALGIDNARWVAHRVWMTEDEARQDKRLRIPAGYEFTDRRVDDKDDSKNRTNAGMSEGQTWVQLIEFYDVTGGVMITFPWEGAVSERSDHSIPWLIVDDMEVPIVQLPNYDISDSPWHIGELEQIGKLQHELNKTRSELMTHRRRNVTKQFVRKGAIGKDAKAALQSPIINEIVEIDTQEPLQNVLTPFQTPPLTSDNYSASNEIKDDIREITGVTEYQRGIAPEITRTATEASIMDAASNVKLQSKLTAIEEAARRLGVILLGISRETFPETDTDEWALFIGGDEAQRLARLQQSETANAQYAAGDIEGVMSTMTEPLGNEAEVKPGEDMFIGEYEVLVEVGSTEYRDPKLRQERLKGMFFDLAQMAPALQGMGVNVDMSRMLRLWLESTDIIDVDSLLAMPAMGMGGMGAPPMGPPEEQLPPEEAMEGGGIPPEMAAMIGNTGMLDSGQIAPATPVGGEPY